MDDVSPEMTQKRRASLTRIDKLAWWLDDAFRIPVIHKRVGVDGLLGLVPFAGDLIGAGMSSVLIADAMRLGAPKRVWLRMGANVGIDFVVGLVPIAGDLFDMAWKANRRNERVMRRWLEQVTAEDTKRSKHSTAATTGLVIAGLAVVSLVTWRIVAG